MLALKSYDVNTVVQHPCDTLTEVSHSCFIKKTSFKEFVGFFPPFFPHCRLFHFQRNNLRSQNPLPLR